MPSGPEGPGFSIREIWDKGWVRGLTISAAVIAGLFGAVAAITPLIDLAPYARPLEVALTNALGRDVIISGAAHLNLFPKLALKMDGVFVANAPGAPSKFFFLADHMTAGMAIDFAAPGLTVEEITADGVNLNLERNAKGEASWRLAAIKKPLDAGLPLKILVRPRTITVTNFRLSRPGETGSQVLLAGRATLLRPRQGSDVLRVSAKNAGGAWNGEANIASLDALASGAPVQLTASLKGPDTDITLKGGREKKGSSLIVTAEGTSKDFSALERLFGLPGGQPAIPATFNLSMKSDNQAGTVQLKFPALGAGDLILDATYKTAPDFEFLGKINAQHLDLRAFIPRFAQGPGGRMFSQAPIATGLLRGGRIAIDLAADKATLGEADLGAAKAGLFADNGVLSAGPMRLSGPAGEFSADATLDTREAPQLALTIKADVPSLGVILAALGEPSLDGRLDAAIELSGKGGSLAEIMGHAAGQTNILFGSGKIAPTLAKTLPNELVFGRAVAPPAELDPEDPGATLAVDQTLDVGCLISRFDIDGGRAESRMLLLETAQAVTTGEGTVDLGKEALNLHLRPRPRDPSQIEGAQDLDVTGPIGAPKWAPATGDARRGLARSPGRVATTEDFSSFMPLLDAQAGLANPCVKALMGESAFAGNEPKARTR